MGLLRKPMRSGCVSGPPYHKAYGKIDPMPFLLFLAQRYLQRRWRQSALLVASVAVGVAILTTSLSLTNGFTADLVDRILGTTPHISAFNALTGRLSNYQPIATQLARATLRSVIKSPVPRIAFKWAVPAACRKAAISSYSACH